MCKYSEENGQLVIEDVPDEFDVTIENVIAPALNTSLMGLYKSCGCFCTQCENFLSPIVLLKNNC